MCALHESGTCVGAGFMRGSRLSQNYRAAAAETPSTNWVPLSRCTFLRDAESVPEVAPLASPASMRPGIPVAWASSAPLPAAAVCRPPAAVAETLPAAWLVVARVPVPVDARPEPAALVVAPRVLDVLPTMLPAPPVRPPIARPPPVECMPPPTPPPANESSLSREEEDMADAEGETDSITEWIAMVWPPFNS